MLPSSRIELFIYTYEPHGDVLLSCIRQYAPQAKVYFHMTWAYETDCTNEQFSNYDYSQQTMYRTLSDTVHTFADAKDIDVIPVGTIIQAVRTLPAFDYANGGISLCRDGRHLSFRYGRYVAAAVWLETVLGINILDVSFAPWGTTPELIEQVRTVVHKCCTQATKQSIVCNSHPALKRRVLFCSLEISCSEHQRRLVFCKKCSIFRFVQKTAYHTALTFWGVPIEYNYRGRQLHWYHSVFPLRLRRAGL